MDSDDQNEPDGPPDLPVDPDVELSERLAGRPAVRAVLREAVRERGDVLAVIAAGGAVGAAARYAVGTVAPYRDGDFPWGTFGVNVSGCLAIGVLMVLVLDRWPAHRYLRPFAGVGVLGGYTPISTYAHESRDLLSTGHTGTALAYLLGSVVGGVAASALGILATRAVVQRPAGARGGTP